MLRALSNVAYAKGDYEKEMLQAALKKEAMRKLWFFEDMDMEISSLSKFFVVRKLTINNVDTIYDMMSKNEIFYQYHPPFVTKESVVEDMEALPPNKSYDDKYYIGFFENDSLVAIMDLILGYPTEEIAFIGLFMTII